MLVALAPSVRHRRHPRFVWRPKRIRAKFDQRANGIQLTEARRPAERFGIEPLHHLLVRIPTRAAQGSDRLHLAAHGRAVQGSRFAHAVEPREGAQLIPARPAVGAAVPSHPVHQRLLLRRSGFRRSGFRRSGFRRSGFRGRADSRAARAAGRGRSSVGTDVMFRGWYDPPLQAAIATEHVPFLVREIFPAERLDFHERSPPGVDVKREVPRVTTLRPHLDPAVSVVVEVRVVVLTRQSGGALERHRALAALLEDPLATRERTFGGQK